MKQENLKLLEKEADFHSMNWSFTIHPPRHVTAFYAHLKESCDVIKEAYEGELSLIAICTGNYWAPTYIALTPNVNLDYLKRKWCLEYCRFHHLTVREYLGGRIVDPIGEREEPIC